MLLIKTVCVAVYVSVCVYVQRPFIPVSTHSQRVISTTGAEPARPHAKKSVGDC